MAAMSRLSSFAITLSKFSARLESTRGLAQKVAVLGVPFNKGQKRSGVGKGPQKLRDAGLIAALKSVSCEMEIVDAGDVCYEPIPNLPVVENYYNFEHVAACQKEVAKRVQEIVLCGQMCLVVGGDHAISAGSVTGTVCGLGDKLPILLWIDAHADINTRLTSISGSGHGMAVALLTKEIAQTWLPDLPAMDWLVPKLSVRDVAYIGLRDVDPGERKFLSDYGMLAYSMEEVDRYGVSQIISAILAKMDPNGCRPIHLSFDIDSLDVHVAPSTGTPVLGGLTQREGLHIVEEVHRTGRLVTMDVVEIDPELSDANGKRHTMEAAIQVCRAAVGYTRRGWPDPGIPSRRSQNAA